MYRYKNRKFSILGDSISTFDGYSEPDYAVFYDITHKLESGVLGPADTWWGRVIEHFGGELLVNNSFSGSMVIKHRQVEIESYGCSDGRTGALHRDDESPDIIMIFLGINDWGCGAKVFPAQKADENDLSVFSVAYGVMLEKLKKNYPDAELWCFTLPTSTCKSREDFAYPYYYAGRHIEQYSQAVRQCAENFGCRLVDLYGTIESYDTFDGFHPNLDGMKAIADGVWAEIEKSN